MPLEQNTVAAPSAADPWSGPLAPRTKPDLITKTWRNEHDPSRRRATFGVPYPLIEIVIEKSADLHLKLPARFETDKRRFVPDVRFRLRASNLIFSEADFDRCKFHRPDDIGNSHIEGATFKNCTFKRCMLGGTSFRHVTFENCVFYRSDFGGSRFDECQFLGCSFAECTAENTSFVATEINPTSVLLGMVPPSYNYIGQLPAGEVSVEQIRRDWLEVRRRLAAQVLRSNTEIHNTAYADLGLFELKRAEVKARFEALRIKKNGIRSAGETAQVLTAWAILYATKGGTSLSRLFLSGLILVPLYAFLLSKSHVTFMNQDCHIQSFHLWLVVQQIARAASLFLAIGYTAFSGGALATVLLTAGALLGLLWYALVAAVVIHRVYR